MKDLVSQARLANLLPARSKLFYLWNNLTSYGRSLFFI